MNNFTQLLLVEAMIYSGLAIFASYLCFASDAFPLADNLDTRVQEYFNRKNITNPSDDQLNLAREFVFQHECEEREKAEKEADEQRERAVKAESDKVVVTDVLLPYVAFVKSRGHIEHLERVFGLAYSHPKNLSPKMLKSSTQMYEYHLMIWEWIWDNCQDPRFLTIKNAAIKEFNNDVPKAKLLVTTSYAGCFLGTSGTLHLPKRLLGLNVTIDDLVAALDDFQDLDADSRTCIKLAWL